MIKMPFNDLMSLTIKAPTIRGDVHKFSTNIYEHKHGANKCKVFFLLSKWCK